MSNYINEYLRSVDGCLVYSNTAYMHEIYETLYIEIYVNMLYSQVSKIRYMIETDTLMVIDLIKKTHFTIQNFSTISTEETYFQQMSIQDCSIFDYTDVEPFMKNIQRIINENA